MHDGLVLEPGPQIQRRCLRWVLPLNFVSWLLIALSFWAGHHYRAPWQ